MAQTEAGNLARDLGLPRIKNLMMNRDEHEHGPSAILDHPVNALLAVTVNLCEPPLHHMQPVSPLTPH